MNKLTDLESLENLYEALEEAEEQIENGLELLDADDVFKELRRKKGI